jgi:predicted acetyltransferase
VPPSSPQVRELTADDLDAAFDVRTRAFGAGDEAFREPWYRRQHELMPTGRALVVEDDGRVVAYARALPMHQWWGGRDLPMAGIAGVVVAPEQRGRGVGSLLMRAVLDRSVALGDAVSVLYPATLPVYRRLGWEVAGARHRVAVDTWLLRRLGGRDVAVRPGTVADTETVVGIARSVHRLSRTSGPLVHDVDDTRETLRDPTVFSYLADDGFVLYGWQGSDLRVHELTAGSEQTARALWSVVGSGSSVARTVHAYVAPRDPLHLLLGEGVRPGVEQLRWMLRVLDLPAAVRARGFAPAVSGQAALVVDDPLVPRNTGVWTLQVAGGAGEVVAGSAGRDALRLDANGLALLFAGLPTATIRVAGAATGGRPEDDALLDAAFAAEPYLLDYF